jgi:hypothetical protein
MLDRSLRKASSTILVTELHDTVEVVSLTEHMADAHRSESDGVTEERDQLTNESHSDQDDTIIPPLSVTPVIPVKILGILSHLTSALYELDALFCVQL